MTTETECIPLSWFKDHDYLTAWEALAVYVVDELGYNQRTGAEAVGKSYFNLRKTYYAARAKMYIAKEKMDSRCELSNDERERVEESMKRNEELMKKL